MSWNTKPIELPEQLFSNMNAQLFPGLGASSSSMMELFHHLCSLIAETDKPLWVASVMRDIEGGQVKNEQAEQRLVHGVNLLCLRLWQQRNTDFEHVCGHSLGFYAALVAAEVIDEESSFALVDNVMTLAKKVTLPYPLLKTITSVQPLAAESVAQSVGAEIICMNSANQIVLHGTPANFRRLETILPSLGMCKVNNLATTVPFHSSLLHPASRAIRDFIHVSGIRFRSPKRAVWSHVGARRLDSCEEIIDTVATQIAKPVRWHSTILEMKRQGVQHFAEATPNRILSRILRWIDPDVCLMPSIQTN
jgi:[acyl-carrier-protein] S-malonyltransferase